MLREKKHKEQVHTQPMNSTCSMPNLTPVSRATLEHGTRPNVSLHAMRPHDIHASTPHTYGCITKPTLTSYYNHTYNTP